MLCCKGGFFCVELPPRINGFFCVELLSPRTNAFLSVELGLATAKWLQASSDAPRRGRATLAIGASPGGCAGARDRRLATLAPVWSAGKRRSPK